ncbi:Heavy metal tolerance protein [Colletotrichum gloeosporioides]|uniref:Heavy metal tolerance protein n=1 Tax=Colletotrichum gloeosporioides TaxID=474922 RepID=A0A8H4CC36_COLGL|nr:Heavy metal tolerance protein [Colletotrichum gloeosporioides]KAF3801024.1 Heavy metal tolerance protein [Colletotrichum gloeosporioides]
MASLEELLESLHYLYPAAAFTYFVIASAVAVCTLQTLKASTNPGKENIPRSWIVNLFVAFVLTYVAQLSIIGIQSIIRQEWIGQEHEVIGLLSCVLVFGTQLAFLSDTEHPVWTPYWGSWIISIVLEPFIAVPDLILRHSITFEYCRIGHLVFSGLRYYLLLTIFSIYVVQRIRASQEDATDEERQSLLAQDDPKSRLNSSGSGSQSSGSGYGSTSQPESYWEERQRKAQEEMEKRLQEEGNWLTYIKGFTILFPYFWPVGQKALQFRLVLVGLCLLAGNALNLLIPRQFGIIVDELKDRDFSSAWIGVGIYGLLRIAASDAGIEFLREWLYLPLEVYADGALSTAAYRHILNLSADFHDSKSTSDISLAMYGGSSISDLLESICFQALPMLIDLVVAVVYLSITLGPYEGFITITTSTLFLFIATKMIAVMKERRRAHVNAQYAEHYVRQTGITGWHTVASFNQTTYEDVRYSNAIHTRINWTKRVRLGWFTAQAFQSLVLLCGLLAGSVLAVYRIKNSKATPGDLTMLLMYWAQLTSPLRFMASLGKKIGSDLIDAERLLDIMKKQPTIVNKKGARPLKLVGGNVDFKDVSFSYDKKKKIINGISLSVPGGQTVAFVGATGAGKSTMLKLLNRFYDSTEGTILIDGQNVRDVDLHSLRDRIGLVPQNPILFDDTIMNNIRYARITASDDEVFDACRAACIHDKIVTFTDGYNTRVGERGIKLSGGELQRVAIARAILKQPEIVLLDEATSSVDTDTEQKIQHSFMQLCKGRTTFIVAHRLSTIMNADRIVVIEDGEVVEQGNHADLVVAKGRYADLWSKQTFLKPKDDDPTDGKQTDATGGETSESVNTQKANGKKPKDDSAHDENGKGANDANNGSEGKPNGHKKEGSKLNPVAAEFTPKTAALVHAASRVLFTTPTASPTRRRVKNWASSPSSDGDFPSETPVKGLVGDNGDDSDGGSADTVIKMNVQLRTPHPTSRRFNSKSESTGQPADDDGSRDDGETDTSSPEIRRVSAPALPMKVTTPAAREITTPVTVVVKKMSPTNRGHEQSSENFNVPHQPTSISPTKSESVPSGKENTRPTAPALSSDHPPHQSNQFRGGRGRSHRGRGGRWRGRQNHNKTPGTPVRSGNQA